MIRLWNLVTVVIIVISFTLAFSRAANNRRLKLFQFLSWHWRWKLFSRVFHLWSLTLLVFFLFFLLFFILFLTFVFSFFFTFLLLWMRWYEFTSKSNQWFWINFWRLTCPCISLDLLNLISFPELIQKFFFIHI